MSCSHPPGVLPQGLPPPLGRGRGLEYLLVARFSLVFKELLNLCGVFVCDGVTNMAGNATEQAVSRENAVYRQAAQELRSIWV